MPHAHAWTPSVSVIIPVHGDRGELRLTAEALAAQDYSGPVEVIVVDNGDNQDLAASLAPLDTAIVEREQTPGSYAARNRGLARAQGEVLAFTDGDCLPRHDWLRQCVESLERSEAPAFVGGRIALFPADEHSIGLAELWDCANGLRQDVYVREQGWAATANMVTTRAVMDLVGPFDARLQSGGDREWGLRATRNGVTPAYAPDAVVDHPARPTFSELHKKIRRVTRGEIDRRRTEQRATFDRNGLGARLRPHTRSILATARRLPLDRRRDRYRYVAVAHWVQYYFLWAQVTQARQAAGGRLLGRRPDRTQGR